jgi:hypothetical protein
VLLNRSFFQAPNARLMTVRVFFVPIVGMMIFLHELGIPAANEADDFPTPRSAPLLV